MEKFNDSDDNVFKTRAVHIKEERAELVEAPSLGACGPTTSRRTTWSVYPQLHELFWNATKTAGSRQEDHRRGGRQQSPRPNRRDRSDLLGD